MHDQTKNNPASSQIAPRCLVFGGTGVVGREVCSLLHQAGARVVFTYFRNQALADQLCQDHPGMQASCLDLSVSQGLGRAVGDMVAPLGGLEAFVHCAAIGVESDTREPFEEFPGVDTISVEQWDRVMAINTRSVFLVSHAIQQSMQPHGGNIVLLGSIDGLKPVPAPLHYAASKGALVAMTRALSKEFAKDKIRVNLLVPGVLSGGLSQTLPVKYRQDYLQHSSLKRLGEPNEVARMAVYLAIDNTYLNGEPIVVDGGL